jgi:outer membrane lipoprotein-sorting protein
MTVLRKRMALRVLCLCLVLVVIAACGRNRNEETPAEAAPAAASAPTAAPAPDAAPAPESVTESATESVTAAEVATTTQSAPASDAAAMPAGGDASSMVSSAMQAQMDGGPFRATTTLNADGTVTEMVSEVIPPDTMRVVIGGGNMELIMVDGTLWSKSGESPWAQMGGTQMMEGILDTIRGQADTNSLTNVQLVGSEPVLGVQTDVYTFTSALGEGEGAITSDVKLWVAQDTGLPVRMESSSVANGVTTTAIQTIEYDPAITITAPTP